MTGHLGTPSAELSSVLTRPGCLVVVAGVAGIGRTTTLQRIAQDATSSARGGLAVPIRFGGGLISTRSVPGLALARAIRAAVPADDPALAVEATKARVRAGLLVIDDAQWADSYTLQLLPEIARHCRVLVGLRTPSGLSDEQLRLLRDADIWYDVPAMAADEATALLAELGVAAHKRAAVIAQCGGNPLAVRAMGHAAAVGSAAEHPSRSDDPALAVAHAVAEAVAVLARPARTALAVLGLLGRPAAPQLLGEGAAELIANGWARAVGELIEATSPYLAQVAASVLTTPERQALHRRIAELGGSHGVSLLEAARHWAVVGEPAQVRASVARAVAGDVTVGERAELLLLEAGLAAATDEQRVAAARAALVAGRPRAGLRILPDSGAVEVQLVRAEALLQLGEVRAGRAAAQRAQAAALADSALRDEWERIWVFAHPEADTVVLRSPLARAVRAATQRGPHWPDQLYTAAREAHLPLDTWWCAWLLITTLANDGDVTRAREYAAEFGEDARRAGAYSWHTRFNAVELWCRALCADDLDAVVAQSLDLLDRALPRQALSYALASACLALADTGALAVARSRLNAAAAQQHPRGQLLAWVDAEVSWLDGQPHKVGEPGYPSLGPGRFASALHEVTSRFAAVDLADGVTEPVPDTALLDSATLPANAVTTLRAWRAAHLDGDAAPLAAAAVTWRGSALREEIRCLLAAAVVSPAVPAVGYLLEAEKRAQEHGLVVLLGRVHRLLRRHAVRRAERDHRRGAGLTQRERQVLELVAGGEPTRRIAGQLGISRMTVETHVRAGMRKLGARTRTEAAALLVNDGDRDLVGGLK